MTKAPFTEQELLDAEKKLKAIKAKQEKLRQEELAIREHIADELHDGEEGRKTITIGDLKVTVERVMNCSITKDDAERFSKENPKEALECLSWSPRVKVSPFREHIDIASEYITVKPGPPTVTFKH